MNKEKLAIIAITLAFTLAAGITIIGMIDEYHIAFAKKGTDSEKASFSPGILMTGSQNVEIKG